MREQRPLFKNPMKIPQFMLQLLLVAALLPTGAAAAQNVNSRARMCPSDATVIGYTSIADINLDQNEELERIAAGTSTPSPPYSFVLCPETEFDVDATPLKPVLSGTIISCGSSISPGSNLGCFLTKGSIQVQLEDSAVPNYELKRVVIIGVTFAEFNGTSIDVTASETLTLTLMDIIWKASTSRLCALCFQ